MSYRSHMGGEKTTVVGAMNRVTRIAPGNHQTKEDLFSQEARR